MKLHLPARLRSALLACLAVAAPVSCTIVTGALFSGAAVVTMVGSTALADEIVVNSGETVTYDAAHNYVLNGGTLDITEGSVKNKVVIKNKDSVINVASGATMPSVYVNLDGADSFILKGEGDYTLEGSSNLGGANVKNEGWKGTVAVSNYAMDAFIPVNLGNANSTLRLSGLTGWFGLGNLNNAGVNLELENSGEAAAVNVTAASARTWIFGSVRGTGDFQRSDTSGYAVGYTFNGDVSDWTGSYINTSGETTVTFSGGASEVNLASISNSSGHTMKLIFDTNSAVVNADIVANSGGGIAVSSSGASGISFNGNVTAKTYAAMGLTTVGSTGVMNVSDEASLLGGLHNYGNTTLNGQITANGTIVNEGTLKLSGTLVVASAGLEQTPSGDSTFSQGNNGVQRSGQIVYSVLENRNGGTSSTSGLALNFDGQTNVTLGNDGTVRAASATPNAYWVNTGTVNLSATDGANQFRMNGGTLCLDATGDAASRGAILASIIGDKGTVEITAETTLAANTSTTSHADLVVSGTKLNIGMNKGTSSFISSFDSVTLKDANVTINTAPGSINNLTVDPGASTIYFADYPNNPTVAHAYVFAGTTLLEGDLNLRTEYKSVTRFENIAGSGSLNVTPSRAENATQVLIDSLEGFTGDLSFAKANGANPYYKVTLDAGDANVAMGELMLGKGAGDAQGQQNIDMYLTIQDGKKLALNLLTLQSNSLLNVTGAAGLELDELSMWVYGVDNTVVVAGDSAMDMTSLYMQLGSTLAVEGKLSGLAVNQVGTTDLTKATLVNGATLLYNADVNPIKIESSMLEGSVKVDLNSLVSAQSQNIANGLGLDLGIASDVDRSKIEIVSDSVRDIVMDSTGDTWTLKGIVTMYWEGNNSWDGNSWTFVDGLTYGKTSFINGNDAVFSGHDAATVSVPTAPDVQRVTVEAGNYTFDTTNFNVGDNLVVKDSATASFNGDLNVQGDVSVAKDSTLSSQGSITVEGGLSGDGTVALPVGTVSLGESSSIGSLTAYSVKMTGSSASDRNMTFTGAAGDSHVSFMYHVNKLTVSNKTLTLDSDVNLGSLSGAGTLNASGILHLNSGQSTIGNLSVQYAVELEKNATLDVADTLSATDIDFVLGKVSVEDYQPVLTAGEATNPLDIHMTVEKNADVKKLTNGMEIELVSVEKGQGMTASLTATEATTSTATGFTIVENYRGYGYELEVRNEGDSQKLVLSVGRDNDGWIGTADTVWTQGEQPGWETGYVPSATPGSEKAAGFFGSGSSVVTIDEAGVETVLLDVDISAKLLDTTPGYTFVGGKLTATNAMIVQGELTIENELDVVNDAEIFTAGALTVADGGSVTIGGNLSMEDKVSLTVQSGGVAEVVGTLQVDEDVTITNAGSLTVDVLDAPISIANTDGELTVKSGGSVKVVEGGSLKLESGVLEANYVDIAALELSGSSLVLKNDSTIGTIDSPFAGGSVDAGTSKLTLTGAAQGCAAVKAGVLTLGQLGNFMGDVTVDSIIFDDAQQGLSTETAALNLNSLTKLSAGTTIGLTLSDAALDAMPVDESGIIICGTYRLIDGLSGLSLSNFNTDSFPMNEILRRGVFAELTIDDTSLLLDITEAGDGDGMIWDMDNGNQVANNGYVIPTGKGLYKSLDYVSQVLLSQNKTIDLTVEGVGDAALDATDPAAGLILRNPDGGGHLTLIGDRNDGSDALPDVATIIGGRELVNPISVTADSMLLNIGMSAEASPILIPDKDGSPLAFKNLYGKNGSLIQVNVDTTVEDQVDLKDGARLMVENGVLTTSSLDGDAEAIIGGDIHIKGAGGEYFGSYSGAQVEMQDGSYQVLQAGAGLSLRVMPGAEATLEYSAADAQMDSLIVGPADSGMARAASASDKADLLLNNTYRDDANNRVLHRSLTLTGDGNSITNSNVTFSLGVVETAKTLNTAKAPVILSGDVAVRGNAITVEMITPDATPTALDVNPDAPLTDAVLATFVSGGTVSGDNTVVLTGTRQMQALLEKYYANAYLAADGTIRVDRVTDYYQQNMQGVSGNAEVGVNMLDKALLTKNPQAHEAQYADLASVMNSLDAALIDGNSTEAERIAAAVAGASNAALSMALAGDMERQLTSIRNRTTTMGVDQCAVNHDMPYFNAWINAEADNRELESDGTLPGFDYTSFGGTVGFDVDMTPRLTFGVALSAMRGDFSSDGSDKLDADVDSYYLTAFARYGVRRWVHTFVASVGTADASMERSVSHSGGSYTAQADTSATSFGAMYEVGYVIPVDPDATACLQPVFNVMFAHTSVDGYSETGSDAGLEVGGADLTTVTVGAGVRFQSAVGQNVFNRTSIFESRAVLKAHAGDREGTVNNILSAVPGATGSVSSAERNAFGFEVGAGITVPLGSKSGSIFVDGSVDLGSGYTAANATVGYRLNF